MSSRLRSLDSKISFFAFADIITAVSGVLIFVALLLATDLGHPTNNRLKTADEETEQKIQDALAQQVAVDAQNRRLEQLLAVAVTAPDPGKLQADISTVRAQLAQEQRKQANLADQLTASHAAMLARDAVMGLTGLKATIQSTMQETATLTNQEAHAHEVVSGLERQITHSEAQLLKLHERDGQLWLIPQEKLTAKEPILVTLSGSKVTIEHFDRPGQTRELTAAGAEAGLAAYLHDEKPENEYVVFLIRPSGIELFQKISKSTRSKGFEIGYDALEEDRQVHFSTPPPIDAPTLPPETVANGMPNGGWDGHGGGGTPGNAAGTPTGNGTGGGGGTGPGTGNASGNGAGAGAGNAAVSGNGTGTGAAANGGGGNPGASAPGQSGKAGKSANGTPSAASSGASTNGTPSTQPPAAGAPPPPKELSWWERLVAWVKAKLK